LGQAPRGLDAYDPGRLTAGADEAHLGSGTIGLKVLETSGGEGEWVTCSCREAITEAVG
ncbi:hypothetical protein Q604_UNBC10373G0001, partial [human gut metagenome]